MLFIAVISVYVCVCIVLNVLSLSTSVYMFWYVPVFSLLFVHFFFCFDLCVCVYRFVCAVILCFDLCACVYHLVCAFQIKTKNKGTYNRINTYTEIKIKEQRHIQEDKHIHTYLNKWIKVQTRGKHTMYLCSIVLICACIFLLVVPLLFCFDLWVSFPLVCAFILLFYSVHVFSSWLWRNKQEENTRTDKNNWTKVHIRGNRRTYKNNWTNVQTRRKYTHR
jgi:hypothetical protein